MSVTVGRQGLEFLWAAALGVGLGFLYDMGRALRRERQRLTVPVDILFALVFFLCLWLSSIYTRGLRLYQCLGVGLGAAAYFLTAGPHLLRLWRRLLRLLGRMKRRLRELLGHLGGKLLFPVKKSAGFFQKLVKKLFSSLEKWSKIEKVSVPSKRREQQR